MARVSFVVVFFFNGGGVIVSACRRIVILSFVRDKVFSNRMGHLSSPQAMWPV